MTLTELDDKSQATVYAYIFTLGTALFGVGYFFIDFVKEMAQIGWYVAVPMWIACLVAMYPIGMAMAKAATTCGKCGTAWAKHQTDEKEVMQIFDRTEKEGDKWVRYEVTRYRIFHECNHCGHRTHQEKQSRRKLI